jgi:DNA polymerase-4
MDAFYASVEQRDRPELRGKPVIVGGLGRRGVVAAASYEARRYGVHSAMPGAVAHRKCPDGVFLRPRMEVYAHESERVRAVFDSFTPLVEPLSLDEAFLDVTDPRRGFGVGEEVGRDLKEKVRAETGLTVSVGVAPSKFVAKVASDLDKPDGLVVVAPGEEEGFLAPLPIKFLWGAGPVTQRALESRGLRHIGDVQRWSRSELIDALGASAGAHFFELCRGVDPRRVEPSREARSISHETTFERDVATREACRAVLLRLSEAVGRRLRKHRLRGRVVRLKVRFPPFVTKSRQNKLPVATDDDLTIHQEAVRLFDRLVPEDRPVRLLGVAVADLIERGEQEPVQQGLFGGAGGPSPRARRAQAAMDAIRDRFGENAIRRLGGGDPDAAER